MEDFIKIALFILMVIVSYYIGDKIAKHKKFEFLHIRGERFGAIDGLRGYLAISIFVHHFMLTWVWKNSGHWSRPYEIYFQNIGIVGVMIFFMITGYLFISKIIINKGKINWKRLYKSRFFRIYPLFLFILLLITIVIFSQEAYQKDINLLNITKEYSKWLIFHGSNIHLHNHTPLIIAGVDWTLKYEWLFYLSLPLIAIFLYINRWLTLLLIIVGIYIFAQDYKIFAFTTIHLIFFIIGGITAYLYNKFKQKAHFLKSKIISILTLAFLIKVLFSYRDMYQLVPIIAVSLFFIAIAFGNSMFGFLEKKSSILLGEISYSIYLLHGFIIYLLFTYFEIIDIKTVTLVEHTLMLPFLVVLVIFSSTLTYLYIEKPAIEYGRR